MYSLSISIITASILFPILAACITIPYLLVHYHKYGSVVIFRALIFYSFILYLLCIYLLVILPLPSVEEVAGLHTPRMQLVPFQFVNDIEMYTKFSVWVPDTYWSSFFSGAFLQVFYNVLMFIPLGIYLRYYYRRNLIECIIVSFLLSLFFELTQLSGLYGIYPRPYRLFDIDDLFLNTIGGVLGFLVEPFFVFLLPSKEQLNQRSYEKGKKVTLFRRFFAASIDWIVLATILTCMTYLIPGISKWEVLFVSSVPGAIIYALLILGYFVCGTYLMKGYTLGKMVVRLKITDEKNRKPKWIQMFVRYGILYGLFVPALSYELQLYHFITTTNSISKIDYGIAALLMILILLAMILFWGRILIVCFTHGKLFLYETVSLTQETSVSHRPDQ